MEHRVLDRQSTFFNNNFLEDYYHSSKLDHLRTYRPSIDEIGKAIKSKKNFTASQRSLLVSVLQNQYRGANVVVEKKVKKNIENLQFSNTFTVTTGQQIHLGLGPLYVIYKAYDTIAIAQELNEKYADSNFVPVFWMATEDHDLEEIAEINIFGNKQRWETTQTGAVGRMKPNGVAELFLSVKNAYNFSEQQNEFLDTCIAVYASSSNLSEAFRRLLHTYLGHTGLVILDADDAEMKHSFNEVMSDELKGKNYTALTAFSEQLEQCGHQRQLHIRPCNLFSLTTSGRKKIELNEQAVASSTYSAHNLSPNAAIRPLYQEWILPNLVYVGGGSELKYWLQLKGLFDNYAMPMPILHLRTSNIVLPRKLAENLDVNDFELFFSDDESIAAHFNVQIANISQNFQLLHSALIEKLVSYERLSQDTFSGFSLASKISKLVPKINELDALVKEQIVNKSRENTGLNKWLKLKAIYFNESEVQERTSHVLAHTHLAHLAEHYIQSSFGFKMCNKVGLFFY